MTPQKTSARCPGVEDLEVEVKFVILKVGCRCCCASFPQFCDFVSLGCVVHLAGKVVRILLDYVGHVSLCPDLRLVLEKQPEWPHILAVLSERPLFH